MIPLASTVPYIPAMFQSHNLPTPPSNNNDQLNFLTRDLQGTEVSWITGKILDNGTVLKQQQQHNNIYNIMKQQQPKRQVDLKCQ
uniref:Uncharacterized protein n=1 Tax=Romanomermis culicivorax TaxID=13658 RepID=A0A915HJ44_ROMCU